MIKRNKVMLIITSIIILIPILVGLVVWDALPDKIATHWNAEGVADGFSSKAVAVFALPAFLLAIHWLCTFVTSMDPKNKDVEGKPVVLVLWICPIISLLMGSIIYATAIGYALSVEIIMPLVMGAMFVVIGNYMPKCKQNYTIGIKVPWTLDSEENWYKTHRFAGILWVIGGVVIMATSIFGSIYVFLGITLAMAFAPTIYSYVYHIKHRKD